LPTPVFDSSRFTLMFEAFAIEVIQACGNVKAAASLLRLDWDSVHRIMERAVERGLKRRDTEAVRYVGIDEKSFRRGQSYVSLLTEQFRWFWEYRYAGNAKKFFSRWYGWAARSRLKPVVRVAKMLKRHLENILTYFRHGITNSMSEGFNSRIQSIKSNARGFRAFTNFRTRILFYCGKLDLTPPELSHNIP
jgi:transposase